MIYLLVKTCWPWLESHGMRFMRVFTFTSFQATVAVLLSFSLCVGLGPWVIRWLRSQKIGDAAQFDQIEIDAMMAGKKGTPTMGGVLIIASIVATVLLLADLQNFYVLMALLCLLWLGAVGAADDWLKLTAARRSGSRQGLTSREKFLFQIGLGIVLCYFTYQYGRDVPESHTYFVPFFKNVRWDVGRFNQFMSDWHLAGGSLAINWGLVAFICIGTIVLTGSSNAVNLTDGLDGLAAGCTAIVSFAFLLLAMIIGTVSLASELYLTPVPASGQMAVLAGAMTGACLGFLWYNCNPATVIMGDTGALAMGGLLGYIAIVVRQELMLLLIGGIFALEAISVLIQVSYFKYTRIRFGEGRRVFLMSPLHHHFQRKGWTETKVVVRFWLIGAILAAMALATVKLR